MATEAKSYQLPDETLPSLGLSHHLNDLVAMRDFLASRGMQTQNTRIDRYIMYLQHACAHGPNDAANIFKNSVDDRFKSPTDWLLYVLREVHELTWIHKGLSVRLPSGVDEKLKLVVSGRDFAALDADSKSRDTQFELRIASYFCQAGCEVHLSQETDIIALTTDKAFYLECKRVGSRGQLHKRLNEARKQLGSRAPMKNGGRKVYSCVAADVTKVAFSHNGLTFGLTNDHSRDVVQEQLAEIARDAQNTPLFRDCKSLLFYWFQIHIPALIYHPPQTVTRFSSLHVVRGSCDRKERRAASVFYGIFEGTSRTSDARETPARKLKLRNTVEVPAGTTFRMDDRSLLTEILERVETNEEDASKVVGILSMNGKDYHFSAFDLRMLPPTVVAEWRGSVSAEPVESGLKLLLEMYLQRFPYQEQ